MFSIPSDYQNKGDNCVSKSIELLGNKYTAHHICNEYISIWGDIGNLVFLKLKYLLMVLV